MKKRLTTKSSTEKRTDTFADEPVKRRLTGKTGTKNDDVLMPVVSVDSYLENTLLSDETRVLETNPWNDDSGQTKIQTILDDPKEVQKGRQKEPNSLREMGVMTTVKRASAAGTRMIRTRRVDREKVGCVKSRLVLKGFDRDHAALSPRCFHRHPRHCL